MANRSYNSFIAALMGGTINWVTDDIRCILVDLADYTPNFTTHDNLDDIPVGARVATAALTGKSLIARGIDANDLTFTSVTGDTSEALVIYKHTGTEGTSTLMLFIDTATGLPAVPGGGNIQVTWNAAGIYTIPAAT